MMSNMNIRASIDLRLHLTLFFAECKCSWSPKSIKPGRGQSHLVTLVVLM